MFLCDNHWKSWKFSIFLLWNSFYGKRKPFLVERTKTENAAFSYKTAISETNVKTSHVIPDIVELLDIDKFAHIVDGKGLKIPIVPSIQALKRNNKFSARVWGKWGYEKKNH